MYPIFHHTVLYIINIAIDSQIILIFNNKHHHYIILIYTDNNNEVYIDHNISSHNKV